MKHYENNVQSVQRVLDILELVGDSVVPVPLKVIANATALPKPTVYRLLNNLERRGYVRTDNDGRYGIGYRFLALTQKADQSLGIKQIARPFIAILNDISKETVHLGVMQHQKVLYVDTVESPLPVRLVARIGGMNAVHCTSLGKALLIHYSDDEILAMLREQGMEKRTDKTITSPIAFLKEMATVRSRGFALDDQESATECFCIGAPILNRRAQAIAAISISGPASRFDKQYAINEVVPHLKKVTGQIAEALGY